MKYNWKLDEENFRKCLTQAFNTYTQYLEDLEVELSEEEFLDLGDLLDYRNCKDKINYLDIDEILGKPFHNDYHDIDEELSNLENYLYGVIVVINDALILDGNHRYNSLYSLINYEKKIDRLKIPVLKVYFEY